MSLDLFKKDIVDSLLSLRLTLAFLLVISLLVASSILFVADYRAQLDDYDRQMSENLASLTRQVSGQEALYRAFSWGRQNIYRHPNHLSFLAEGREKDLPNGYRVNAFKLEGPDYSLRSNPLLGDFDVLDWGFIVGNILSFAAILMAHDSINGEKQRGTLRLILSNPVPRARFLISKYLSAFTLLTIPLVIGSLTGLLVITASGLMIFRVDDWVRVGLIFLVSLLYLSLFIVLGLLISTSLKEPQASLVVSLLVWVVLVIIVPSGATLTGTLLVDLPTTASVQEEGQRAAAEAKGNYDRRHPHPDNWAMSGQWSPGEPLLRAFEVDDARNRVMDRYEDQKISQVTFSQNLSRLSPSGLYQSAALSISGAGILHHRDFTRQARRYRETLRNFVNSAYSWDKVLPSLGAGNHPSVRLQIDFQAIPKFEEQRIPIREEWNRAVWDTGILALLNVIFFALTWVLFLRSDVR
jgi:ABC-type transport system involved in multi-copper enzyme maturation permease subunit